MKLIELEAVNYDIESKYREELAYLRKERAQNLYKTIK